MWCEGCVGPRHLQGREAFMSNDVIYGREVSGSC